MSDGSTVMKVFLEEPDGRRKAGRSKLRWLDCIENVLKSMGAKKCREKAADGSGRAIVLKETLLYVIIRTEC